MTGHDVIARMVQMSRSLGLIAAEGRSLQARGLDLPEEPLREISQALRALADTLDGRAPCALCHAEPVALPDQAADTVEGRFCAGCIARCLDDTSRGHWCPIDTLARADEVPTDV